MEGHGAFSLTCHENEMEHSVKVMAGLKFGELLRGECLPTPLDFPPWPWGPALTVLSKTDLSCLTAFALILVECQNRFRVGLPLRSHFFHTRLKPLSKPSNRALVSQ
jgi:hypothetical protein